MLRPVRILFFVSGFAALLYQIVWERALALIYGSNVESVTLVVTAFMVGLGVGNLLGGELSRSPERPFLLLFGVFELCIGVYGLLSLPLFRAAGAVTLQLSLSGTAASTLLLVIVPTVLMGATLPLLLAHAVRAVGNVGRSVGALYAGNTLGSAAASLFAAFFVLHLLGMRRTVLLAAALNLAVGLGACAVHFRERR